MEKLKKEWLGGQYNGKVEEYKTFEYEHTLTVTHDVCKETYGYNTNEEVAEKLENDWAGCYDSEALIYSFDGAGFINEVKFETPDNDEIVYFDGEFIKYIDYLARLVELEEARTVLVDFCLPF